MFSRTKSLNFLFAALLSVFMLSCGGENYFKESAVKNSDEALFIDALRLMDSGDWDGALAKINALSSYAQRQPDAVKAKAGIYAGKCGLNFLNFVEQIRGTGSPFSLFMSGFTATAVSPSDCQTAQEMIETLGATAAQRTASLGSQVANNLNMFMAILGMAKIGTNLRNKADTDQNGTTDGGFDACNAGSITDDEIVQVGTGFALVLDNIATIAATLDSSTSGLITSVSTTCGASCTITSPTDPGWNMATRTVIRSLVDAQTFGIGACTGTPSYPIDCCP